jgi:putative transposase
VVTPVARREAVRLAGDPGGLSERRACRLIGAARGMVRYRARRPADDALRSLLTQLASERRRWGYRRLAVLIQRAGVRVNLKRLRRIYRAAGLQVRRRPKRLRQFARVPALPVAPTAANVWWAMDFLRDALGGGRAFRVFTLDDLWSPEALALTVDHSLPAARIIRVLDGVAAHRAYPTYLRVDNGPEFISLALDAWAYQHHAQLVFIAPGKPIQNAHVERFNGRVRDEFLNEHWFASVAEAQVLAEVYRVDFNTVRPHSALKNRTPEEFVLSWASSPAAPVRSQDQAPEPTAAGVT